MVICSFLFWDVRTGVCVFKCVSFSFLRGQQDVNLCCTLDFLLSFLWLLTLHKCKVCELCDTFSLLFDFSICVFIWTLNWNSWAFILIWKVPLWFLIIWWTCIEARLYKYCGLVSLKKKDISHGHYHVIYAAKHSGSLRRLTGASVWAISRLILDNVWCSCLLNETRELWQRGEGRNYSN